MSRGRLFSEFSVGQVFESSARTVSEAEVMQFAELSGDFNPLHVDDAYAKKTPFGQRIAHGMLAASISTGLGQDTGIFEGTTLALMEQTFRYRAPVFFGESIRLRRGHLRRGRSQGRGHRGGRRQLGRVVPRWRALAGQLDEVLGDLERFVEHGILG